MNELLCGSKGARSKCDAGERSAAKALCRSAKRDEELAAGGGQVRRQSRRRDPGGKNHITRHSPPNVKNGGVGENLSPTRPNRLDEVKGFTAYAVKPRDSLAGLIDN